MELAKDQSSRLVYLNSFCMHKITNLWKFELNWSSKLQDHNERNTLVTSCVRLDGWFRDIKF